MIEDAEVIFIGYQLWYGEEPRILDTLVESYDFSGKTIVVYCVSEDGNLDKSYDNLKALTKGNNITWIKGKCFKGNETLDEVYKWVNGLGLGYYDEEWGGIKPEGVD